MNISICIPMYNEISTVAATAASLVSEMDAYCGKSGDNYEIIFSDDGSLDGTYDAIPTAESLSAVYGVIHSLSYDINLGKGAAVRRGILTAEGDIVMYTDCDLAYGTKVIPEAIEIMKKEKPHMLVGSRAIHPKGYEGYTILRKLASKAYIRVLALLTGIRVSDSQCGFKVFDGKTAKRIFSLSEANGWAFDLELFLLAKRDGALLKEMPVTIVNHRESRISVMRDSVKMLREVMKIKKRVRSLDK